LNPDGTEAVWPEAEVIIGNPPFLGVKKMRRQLGNSYTEQIRRTFPELSEFSDLVCFWFEKGRHEIRQGRVQRVGLVATNSIRGGANRKVLDRIVEDAVIFEAWSDEPWVQEGAAVRVSIVCFARREDPVVNGPRLDGRAVRHINPDLTSSDAQVWTAVPLTENAGRAFNGIQKSGPFEIDGATARRWLSAPRNPNGRPNSDVLKPYWIGLDLTRRPRDSWVIDFGTALEESDAALYIEPFEHARNTILPYRREAAGKHSARSTAEIMVSNWWRFWRPRDDMRQALRGLERYMATNEVAKHRLFVWVPASVLPDKQLIVIARDDDTSFGIVHSRFHELWSLRLGTWLGVGNDPRYTPTTTFETFPFPEGLTPNLPASAYAADPRARAIAEAARALHEKREAWLNPPDLVRRVPEVVPGYPDRLLPIDEKAAAELKKRTLTRLYNDRPQWLRDLHRALDEAVAAAYGWPADLTEEEVLARLLALNRERARAGR
jgi:type II restriction/modification system DNA methylase subunit YeeA